MTEDDLRGFIAKLLVHRCVNCYSQLPGPLGCSVHHEGWHWLTPNLGPLCDTCWKEVETFVAERCAVQDSRGHV